MAVYNQNLQDNNSKLKVILQTINSLPKFQKPKPEEEKIVDVIENGTQIITPTNGSTLSKVTVNTKIPSDKKPEIGGQETITENGQKTFMPPSGSVFNSFTVDTNVYIPPDGDELLYGKKV